MSADRLGLGTQVRELKIGKSFTSGASSSSSSSSRGASSSSSSSGASTSFSTIRYDFKPASVDTNQTGSLEIAEDNRTVTVNVPNLDGNQQTNYL